MITRKGVHPTSFDNSIDLIDRWKYAQDLAKFINSRSFDDIERDHLKSEINEYIDLLDRSGFSDADVYHSAEKRTHRLKSSAFWKMILFLPTLPLGLLHCYLPFKMAKNFAEKKFKRKVFWGSVKVVAGMILMGIINIPFIFLFDAFVYPNIWLALLYYIAIPFFGLGAYSWFDALHEYQNANRLLKTDLSELIAKRKILLDKIESYVKI